MNLSQKDKNLIADAIRQVELKTSGEVVPVIVKSSDLYPAAHFRLSLIVALLCSFLSYYLYDFNDPLFLILIQFPGMILGYYLAYIPFFKRALCSDRELAEEVHQRALEAFYRNDVSLTKERTGILIFVSMLEHKIEVLGDVAINAKVAQTFWDDLVLRLGKNIKEGKLTEGMVEAIHCCGETLSLHFSRSENDQNELEDKLHS